MGMFLTSVKTQQLPYSKRVEAIRGGSADLTLFPDGTRPLKGSHYCSQKFIPGKVIFLGVV